MTDLHKNEKIEKLKNEIMPQSEYMRHVISLYQEFHDRLTNLEKRFSAREPFYEVGSLFIKSGRKEEEDLSKEPPSNGTSKSVPGESERNYYLRFLENLPPEPHLGMIDLEAFSKLQAESMDLRQQIVKLSNMFWDEVKASLLWKQKYETSYNELRALKMDIK